jgi:hypothetical protein
MTPRKSRERTDIAAYSIREFADAHGMSESFYYRLRKQGLGPDEMKVLGRTMISQEAAARWRRAREEAAS